MLCDLKNLSRLTFRHPPPALGLTFWRPLLEEVHNHGTIFTFHEQAEALSTVVITCLDWCSLKCCFPTRDEATMMVAFANALRQIRRKSWIFATAVRTMRAMPEITRLGRLEHQPHKPRRMAFNNPNGHLGRPLALMAVILSRASGVLASPVCPRHDPRDLTTDLMSKSYELDRHSFVMTLTMGVIMITITIISTVVAIVDYFSRRGTGRGRPYEPRNPVNCEAGAAAHAALRQHLGDRMTTLDLGHELGLVYEAAAAAEAGKAGSSALKGTKPLQQPASIPIERLPRTKMIVETSGVGSSRPRLGGRVNYEASKYESTRPRPP
ncbi:hypothetical protein F4777DRAFT_298542 [Nemania sp. FL0916]|nr:hypothetical protein F4777DRAFT_298542 [Nemania sp. FL0916]